MSRKLIGMFIVAACLCVIPAAADTIDYTITGPSNFSLSFSLGQNPTYLDGALDRFGNGYFTLGGVSSSCGSGDSLTFYSAVFGGGLVEGCAGLNLFGNELFHLNGSQISLLTGTFTGSQNDDGQNAYTITATSENTTAGVGETATPEPGSLVLLGTGLLAIGGTFRRKLRM